MFSKNNIVIPEKNQQQLNSYVVTKNGAVNNSPIANIDTDIIDTSDIIINNIKNITPIQLDLFNNEENC
jgi:hypothetical protein